VTGGVDVQDLAAVPVHDLVELTLTGTMFHCWLAPPLLAHWVTVARSRVELWSTFISSPLLTFLIV
jgi:hypothetical protein